jgi:hypothetical protein
MSEEPHILLVTEGRIQHLTTPSWRKINKWEREREKDAVNRGHYVLPARPKGSALTLLRTIIT